MKNIRYIYWRHDDMWLGYLDEFPDYWTQGGSIEELQENLQDISMNLWEGKFRKCGELLKCASHETKRLDSSY